MKDGSICKLTITKTGHRASQFKKIGDALPVFCADKNNSGLDEVLRTGYDKVKDDLMPAYPDANRWSSTHHIQIAIVNPNITEGVNAVTEERPVTHKTMEQTIITDKKICKNSYYRNTYVIQRTSPKSTSSSLQRRSH